MIITTRCSVCPTEIETSKMSIEQHERHLWTLGWQETFCMGTNWLCPRHAHRVHPCASYHLRPLSRLFGWGYDAKKVRTALEESDEPDFVEGQSIILAIDEVELYQLWRGIQ